MKQLLLAVSLVISVCRLQAQPVKRIYLANDDHTDYMWTGNEAQYDTAFVRMLDYYMNQIDSTVRRNNADDFQARFNCDGSYWLKTYQKYRSPAQFERLMGYIKSGHISSPLNSLVSTYGGQPTEAVLRGMFYAGQLERQFNLRFPMAVCMENQTLPLGLSSLWAGSGAKYSWRGVCACASQIPKARFANRSHQLYRYMGPDNRSVTMKWYGLKTGNRSLGGYAEARQNHPTTDIAADLAQTIARLTTLCDTSSGQSAYPYNAAAAFGYGWDDLSTFVSPAFIRVAQLGTTPQRRVRVSNEEDFFRDIDRNYPKLPAESLSYGNEWDLYPASMNETTAQVRRATEKMRTAEALATLASLKDSTFAADLTPVRKLAWDAYGMYWEHDWTADGPVTRQERATWQIKIQRQISGYVDTLFNRSIAALGRNLNAGTQANTRRFYVFNPLSWVRSDVADVEFAGKMPVKVVDIQTGAEVASQLIRKGNVQYLRIWAENLPSVGYNVYEIRAGNPAPQQRAATVKSGPDGTKFIQNAYYRIRLHKSGVISELVDLRAGQRNIVKPLGGRLLNDLGTVNPDAGRELVVENAGAVSVTLKAVSNDPIAHTVRVTLFRNSRPGLPDHGLPDHGLPPRIDIEDSIQANFGDLKVWAFSLNLSKPTTNHEELGAILTAKKEKRGGHYAAQNARLDWLTFNHFADLSEPAYGVTLSNQDCSFFTLGHSTPDSLWETSAQLNALAGGQVDGEKLGILKQNGATAFRYQFAMTTHNGAFDALAAMRFSLEHQNPLVAGLITGSTNRYPATTFSLLNLSDKNVLLWSLKPSEEGINQGLIARFWNVKNTPVSPTIRLVKPIRQAWQTSHIETNEHIMKLAKGHLNLPFAPHQLNTYRLQLQP